MSRGRALADLHCENTSLTTVSEDAMERQGEQATAVTSVTGVDGWNHGSSEIRIWIQLESRAMLM